MQARSVVRRQTAPRDKGFSLGFGEADIGQVFEGVGAV